METKYMLMRKIGKKRWQLIYIDNDKGENDHGGFTLSKESAESQLKRQQERWPEYRYAIVEHGDL